MKAPLKLILFIALLIIVGCGKESDSPAGGGTYACPMLCVITDHPGDCPVCGMEMASVKSGTSAERNTIELDEHSIRRSSIRTALATKAIPHFNVPMVGKVVPNETQTAVISAWVEGRIDRLHIETTGIEIKQGDKLADIYSPALISAQQELIQAVQNNDDRMATLVREKLRRYGIDDAQIETIAQQTEPLEHLTLTAPTAGTVLSKNIIQGETVKRGDRLYRIADLSTVWIELQAYEVDIPRIKLGQRAMIEPGGLHGTILFIDPVVNPKTHTARVRVSVANPEGALRPEMLLRAVVHAPGKKPAVLIPASAPLITGERARVYVQMGENVFEGRDVTLGPRAGEFIVIESGINPGDEVVVNGAFRIDAAMQISGRASMMNPKPEDGENSAPVQMHNH